MDDDEALLARAESVLTQLKIAQGLTEEQASLLAALRIRLKGKADASLEEMLESAGDLGAPAEGSSAPTKTRRSLDEAISQPEQKRSLDELLAKPEKPTPNWPT